LYDENCDIQGHPLAPTGTSTAAALRRLRKHRPDLHELVLADQMSAHAAMIKAGLRKPRPPEERAAFTADDLELPRAPVRK
jgi:hypothetical protein